MSENKPDTKHVRRGIKAIWRHLQPSRGQLIILGILGIISAAANGFVPYITGRFFDALIGVSQHQSAMFGAFQLWAVLLGAWVLIQLVANNIDWVIDRMNRFIDTGLRFKIQTDGFVHMFLLPLSYHKDARSNGELEKISQASWRVSAIASTIIGILPQFLSIIIGITLAASISHLLALILVLGVALYILLLVRILTPIAAIDAKAHKLWNESWDNSYAAVQQVESVKQAAAEQYEISKVMTNLMDKTRNLWLQLERNWSNVSFFQRMIVFLTQLTIFILSVGLVSNGDITVGQLVALNGYSMMFFGPFVTLGHMWQVIQNGITTAANAETIFDQKEEVYAPARATVLKTMRGEVRFDQASFNYGPGQPEVLSGIDFVVKPGQVVALVGESGVGKSTTISLISGYHFPSSGAVTVDGIDTRKLDLGSLRRHIAVVPQEVALFNDTIRANVSYGTFDASGEQIMAVAKKAHIDDFVSALPKKYETLVGERGIKLSVGQKQRVAIARAMLREPAILILDEPTSALDAGTEKIVTEALEQLMRGRTTFIIAHRLSTVRKADMILVFQKGKIVETGSHQELIAKEGGVYQKLYDYQIGLH